MPNRIYKHILMIVMIVGVVLGFILARLLIQGQSL